MNKLEIRKTQALYNYSTGSIADLPEVSLMICSPDIYRDAWGGEGNGHKFVRSKIEDERIASIFNVKYFVEPPEPNNTDKVGIKAVRFPATMFCPSCKTIHYLEELHKIEDLYWVRGNNQKKHFDQLNKGLFCPSCYESNKSKIKLTPSRFIIANEYGLIDDFPWDWYCHRDDEKKPKRKKEGQGACYFKGKKPGRHLKLDFSGGKASLSDMSVRCTECGAQESLGGIFNQDDTFLKKGDNYLPYVDWKMSVPWEGYSKEESLFRQEPVGSIYKGDSEEFGDDEIKELKRRSPRTLQRGAGNVHFPVTHRAISLPKKSYKLEINAELKFRCKYVLKMFSLSPEFEGMSIEDMIKAILDKGNSYIENMFSELIDGQHQLHHIKQFLSSEVQNVGKLSTEEENRRIEYDCFLNFDDELAEPGEWYNSTVLDGEDYTDVAFLDKVVLLHKLKQLNVLRGFTRVNPLTLNELIFTDNEFELGGNSKLQKEYQRIRDVRRWHRKRGTEWLPANIVKGEGVFLTIKDKLVEDWINTNPGIVSRINKIKRNYISNLQKFNSDFIVNDIDFISVRYVLLHTFSHILIDQIAQYSGYNAASLSEIIYTSSDEGDATDRMNGILIYTSSSDAEGTLGGLVNHGQPGKLEDLIRMGLEKAKWCSSDPLCIETEGGQGFMGVNLAACHSCCMLPESCCENMNRFLDRALLVGTINKPNLGFINYCNLL
jgi:hypothetical protein